MNIKTVCTKHCSIAAYSKFTVSFHLGGRGNWTTDGCELIEIDGNVVTCHCNHLTNFGCLVVCEYNQWSLWVHNIQLWSWTSYEVAFNIMCTCWLLAFWHTFKLKNRDLLFITFHSKCTSVGHLYKDWRLSGAASSHSACTWHHLHYWNLSFSVWSCCDYHHIIGVWVSG